jgi:phosphatidylserine decarboxylase
MKFHKEGYVSLLIAILVSALIIWLGKLSGLEIVFFLSIGLAAFLLIIILQFFRNPTRPMPEISDSKVYAPADGKVVVIEKVFEKEYLKKECWQVSIFMSPLNVHINRNPVNGKVEYLKYHPGKYLVAWHPKSSELNERYTTVYDMGDQQILIRQIAGALARRIVNYLKPNDSVQQGQEMGFIKFGSRVDVFVPLNAKIEVELNQVVRSPMSLLATLQD